MVKVVGITGTMGSGKYEVTNYLKQKSNCIYVKISDVLRNEMKRKKNSLDRKTLQDSGDEMRKAYGNHILAKVSTDYLPRDKQLIIIDGIRNPGEVGYLRKTFGKDFILIAIDSTPELRFERLKNRGRSDDPKTWEEFLEMDSRDQGVGQPEHGQQVKRCIIMADSTIENNGSLEEFQGKIAEVAQKILG